MQENKPPSSLSSDDLELIDEITRLRDALYNKERASVNGCTEGLIVARLCAGLTLAEWEGILREGHFPNWLALPASGESLPHLMRIQRTMEELVHQTRHDPLTGLANRRAFEKTLRMELERSYRGQTSLSLAILDLDNFKAVNDKFGHLCGDRVLVSLAGALLGHKRAYDMAARIGGEEFALILPGSGLMQADSSLGRLLDDIRSRSIACDGVTEPLRVTCSVGVVCTKGKIPISVEAFVDMADKALYEAKAQGKNRVVKAPIPDLLETPQATLVHANEKQFLFTGPDT